MDKIKVAIIEDDTDWTKILTNFLHKEDDIIVVGTANNKIDGIALAKSMNIDIIIMDINLNTNKCDGIYATAEILQDTKSKIIMLTCLKDENIIRDSFTAGAVNFISKEKYLDIPNAIRSAYRNDSPYQILLKEFSRLKREEQLKDLSYSEKEIYELIEQGYSKAQIEKQLFKTKSTIKTHIKRMLIKLSVNNCKEAVKKVKSKGLCEKQNLS